MPESVGIDSEGPAPQNVLDTLPSLRDEPCRYPDARAPEERQAYVYRDGLLYALDVAEEAREGQQSGKRLRSPAETPVLTAAGPLALSAWLEESGSAPLERRIATLAVGSNAYPRQLADKFREHPVEDDSVVVMACRVRDLEVVFCASLSRRNGYIPVSVRPHPGTVAQTWLQWLTAEQMQVISATEGPRYGLVEVGDGGEAVTLVGAEARLARVYAWQHDAVLDLGDGPIRLDEAGSGGGAEGGEGVAMSESEVLHDAVARYLRSSGESLTWDGCSVPAERRAALQEFLGGQVAANTMLPHWWLVDRSQAGFAEALVAAGDDPV